MSVVSFFSVSWKALAFILIGAPCFFLVRQFAVGYAVHEGSLYKAVQHVTRRVQGIKFLVAGPQIIEEAYKNAVGNSFTIPTPSNDYLMITSSDSMLEMTKAPHYSLSLHAVAKELLRPKYTMQGFEWQDQRGVEGTGFVRAIRSVLTSHLPRLQPHLENIIRDTLKYELIYSGSDGYCSVKLFPMVKRIITRTNCFVFFGEELSKNVEFRDATQEFPEVVVYSAECLRLTPPFLHSFIASLTTSRHRAAKILVQHLGPVVTQRLARRADKGQIDEAVPEDCIQWLIDTSPRKVPWSPDRMIGEIIAVWFATFHQLAITTTWAIEDLCLHSECIIPLRQELREHVATHPDTPADLEKLPLLDSFVRESMRYTNADSVTCRRKALHEYVFKDGSTVRKHDWVCIPQGPMLLDERRFRNASVFDGFRFAEANKLLEAGLPTSDAPDKSPACLTTANPDWPIWGLGNTAWQVVAHSFCRHYIV